MTHPGAPLKASLEALQFRGTTPLYQDLRMIYLDALAGEEKALERIASVIRKRTGILLSTLIYESPHADLSIYFIPFDINGVFRSPELQNHPGTKVDFGHLKPLLQGQQGQTTDRGAVKGIFTKIPCQLVLTTGLLQGKELTAEELAAMTLHEVGHAYGYFDTLGRCLATSLAVAQTQAILAETKDLATRKHAIASAAKVLHLGEIDATSLAAPEEAKSVDYVFIRDTVAKLASDLGSEKLFGGEVEYLADSYAVRSGASQPLLSGMMKLYKASSNAQLRKRGEYVLVEGLKVGVLLAGALHPAILATASLLAGLAIANQSKSSFVSRNTPIERVEAVHGELVQLLKDRTLPASLRESLLSDVQFVSGVREQLAENLTLVTHLWLTLSPTRRKHYKQVKLQQELNQLINNDLFVQAAKLRSLSH